MGHVLITFFVHALAASLWAGQNDMVNNIGLLCDVVRRGLTSVTSKCDKTLLLGVQFGQGDLVCLPGAVMNVLLLALATHRPARLDAVVILPTSTSARRSSKRLRSSLQNAALPPTSDAVRTTGS